MKVSEFQLRDVVKLTDSPTSPFLTSVVIQIKDGFVTLFRPYVHTSDFSHSGGVTPYIGIETYKVDRNSHVEYDLLERSGIR